jgi:hypothetical protein
MTQHFNYYYYAANHLNNYYAVGMWYCTGIVSGVHILGERGQLTIRTSAIASGHVTCVLTCEELVLLASLSV